MEMDSVMFTEALTNGVDVIKATMAGGKAIAETLVASTMSVNIAICKSSVPQNKPRHWKRSAYWWPQDIAELRGRCFMLRQEPNNG